MIGEVVKLDRKFPLVELPDGRRVRCEHSADLKKHGRERAVIGDIVEVKLPEGHDVGVIVAVRPRSTLFVRKDPTDRMVAQVLAANFDIVIVVQPADALNIKRLERELVLAHETGARVAVVLTKADLLDGFDESARLDGSAGFDGSSVQEVVKHARELAGADVDVLAVSQNDVEAVERTRKLIGSSTAVLIGRSGVGKSTLINRLLGRDAQATSAVRERDGKGRHTTVSREIVQLPSSESGESGGRIIDMPGVRGLGLWSADEGLAGAFSDIESLATECRFRDCKHSGEPGCAVRAAVERGDIAEVRLASYLNLQAELARNQRRRRESSWKNR